MRSAFFILLTLSVPLSAQLVLTGPIPKTTNPPVIFINGYQSSCGGSFSDTFTQADQVLAARGIVSLFFDNCSVAPAANAQKATLQAEGQALGRFIASLKYTDGTAVPQVDVVMHSMGGLILRAYLAGMQDGTPAVFNPPADPKVRRIAFIATPHFGSTIAGLGSDEQTAQLRPGSQFLFDLNSWTEGTDDLRGIPAVSLNGNGGTGVESGVSAFDDGVTTLTSASLNFYRPGVTRVLPDCHTTSSLLVLAQLCPSTDKAPPLTNITTDPANPVSQFLVSWLTGTEAWKTIGQPVDSTNAASYSGVIAQARDASDVPQPVTSAGGLSQGAAPTVAWAEELKPGMQPVQVNASAVSANLPAASENTSVVKPGPAIFAKGISLAVTQPPFPYDLAPGAFVAIYGQNFATAASAQLQPYPVKVADLQVLVGGTPAEIQYASAGQINIVFPSGIQTGLTQLTVRTGAGQHTMNVRVAPVVPALFQTGATSAAAVDATTGVTVSDTAATKAGHIVSLYLTGLGATDRINNLDYAHVLPTVTVGGANCPVLYAGRNPSFEALDQINCTIPAGASGAAVPVVVTSNGRASAVTTLNIQ